MEDQERPFIITALCLIGWTGLLSSFARDMSEGFDDVADWYPPFLVLSTFFMAVCVFGFWRMRRWAVYAFTGFYVIYFPVMLLLFGYWHPGSVIAKCVCIAILFAHFGKMD
ncbi:MAG TPA: hypothetical protein VNQ90_11610 [Chthoniobacteraceae bacterium]|nr:hypothetical protein [Chthoniobacteraceae bacterium]